MKVRGIQGQEKLGFLRFISDSYFHSYLSYGILHLLESKELI